MDGKHTISAFCDAGYATLKDSGSIQPVITCIGKLIERNGPVLCGAHHIDLFTKKINRVARSTLAAETVSVAEGLDYALWLKTVLCEIILGSSIGQSSSRPPLCH